MPLPRDCGIEIAQRVRAISPDLPKAYKAGPGWKQFYLAAATAEEAITLATTYMPEWPHWILSERLEWIGPRGHWLSLDVGERQVITLTKTGHADPWRHLMYFEAAGRLYRRCDTRRRQISSVPRPPQVAA